jgi:hypothetical protein
MTFKTQAQKNRMGYIKTSKICRNCAHFDPGHRAMPATELQPAMAFKACFCKRGRFSVKPDATCNEFEVRVHPLERPSMNPGLLDDLPLPVKQDLQMKQAAEAFGGKIPRLAGEWSR